MKKKFIFQFFLLLNQIQRLHPTHEMCMILGALEAAVCGALIAGVMIGICAVGVLTIQWLSEYPGRKLTKNKFMQTKQKWMDDKKRLLAESKAIFDHEAFLIEHLQRGEDKMTKEVIDAAGLESLAVLERHLDEHWFKIRQNWRELADLLDRYCDWDWIWRSTQEYSMARR